MFQGEKLVLEADLSDTSLPSTYKTNYIWSVLFKKSKKQWEERDLHTENKRGKKLIINTDKLKPATDYTVSLTVLFTASIKKYSTYFFTTNSPPKDGRCYANNVTGVALTTKFTFSCEGWVDDDLPLSYEFSYETSSGLSIVLEFGNQSSATTRLPPGDAENDHKITVDITIRDRYGAAAKKNVSVEVSKGLDSVCCSLT